MLTRILHRALFVPGEPADVERRVDRLVRRRKASVLREAARAAYDDTFRGLAIAGLVELKDTQAVPLLLSILENRNPEDSRPAAAWALGELVNEHGPDRQAVIDALLGYLLSRESVRRRILDARGPIPEQYVTIQPHEAESVFLRVPTRQRVCDDVAAIGSLCRLKAREVLQLIALYVEHGSTDAFEAFADMVVRCERERAFDYLAPFVHRDAYSRNADIAVRALGRIRDRRGADLLLDLAERLARHDEPSSKDGKGHVGFEAATALEDYGQELLQTLAEKYGSPRLPDSIARFFPPLRKALNPGE
jgi:PBS lyase HEAT-like repeat.